jgi:hypothetical protein
MPASAVAQQANPPEVLASPPPGTTLTYHGGWVMRTTTTYTIFWFPPGSTCGASDPTCSGYMLAINGYFKDLAAANGSNSNIYSVDTQYSDTTGPIGYQTTFGGAFLDLAPFPPYNPSTSCTDGTDPVCLTDQQIQAEIQRVITAVGWPDGKSSLFTLLTPDSVGACGTNTDNHCVPAGICAWHGGFVGSNTQPVIYTYQPLAATMGCAGNPLNPSPNGDAADPTINLIDHEMNEAITDPWGDGWYVGTTQGGEIADLCAWNFGNPLGTAPNGQAYNEVINGHYYYLQQEWSNDGHLCLQRYIAGTVPPSNLGPPAVTGTAAVGKLLSTSNGTWAGSPTSYSYQWQRCTNAAQTSSCGKIPGANAATYQLAPADAGFVVRFEVIAANAAGTSAAVASEATAVVVPVLVPTTPPAASGIPAVGRTLTLTDGTWNVAVDSFAYQWLRCAADGSGCTPIVGATQATYTVVDQDVDHTIEGRVEATNAAGTATALSNRTALVVASPVAEQNPRIQGRAKAGRRLTASSGDWSGSPTSFSYRWLRCNARGSHCRTIRGGTHGRYILRTADVGHRLRVRVTATNVAGQSTATSRATALVTRSRG